MKKVFVLICLLFLSNVCFAGSVYYGHDGRIRSIGDKRVDYR